MCGSLGSLFTSSAGVYPLSQLWDAFKYLSVQKTCLLIASWHQAYLPRSNLDYKLLQTQTQEWRNGHAPPTSPFSSRAYRVPADRTNISKLRSKDIGLGSKIRKEFGTNAGSLRGNI